MTILEEIQKHKTATFSWSSYRDIIECPMKATYRLILGRTPIQKDNWDLTFGLILHQAIDERTKTKSLEAALDAINKWFTDNEAPDDPYGRDHGRALTILEEYHEKYPLEGDPQSLGSEQEVTRLLNRVVFQGEHIDIQWKGILDDLWLDGKTNFIKDTKTSKQSMSFDRRAAYNLSGQLMMYCWLAECNQAVVDFITLKKPLTRKTSDESRNEFERNVYHYTDERLVNMAMGVTNQLKAWLELVESNHLEHMPKKADSYSCSLPYRCPYFEACCAPSFQESLREINTNPNFTNR